MIFQFCAKITTLVKRVLTFSSEKLFKYFLYKVLVLYDT